MALPPRHLTRTEFEVLAAWLNEWEVSLPPRQPEGEFLRIQPWAETRDMRRHLADVRGALRTGPSHYRFDDAVQELRWLTVYYGSPEAQSAAHADELAAEYGQSARNKPD